MNPDILQAIATGLVTILGFFMFYDSKKRTEAAKASQEEAKATAQYASGWKDLCERKDSELKTKDEKIDSLYDALNQHRASEDKLKDVTGGVKSRCIPFNEEHIGDTCVCCGKPAKHMVVFGRQY